jgi:hypothetical protein
MWSRSWARWSRWKLAFLLLVGLCIFVQLLFICSLWRESDVRRLLRAKGHFHIGESRLPASVDMQLRRWIGSEKAELFAPIVELYIQDPTASDLAHIANLTHLQALSIKAGAPAGLRRLGTLRELTTFELCDVDLDANSLSGLSGCTKLCRVKIVGNITPEALESLKHCESLCELYLDDGDHFDDLDDGVQKSPINSAHLAALAKIPHLKHLLIESGEIHDTELYGLARARELETLTMCLRLHSGAINFLGRLPRLRKLDLRVCNNSYVPGPLKGFLALRTFSITNSRIAPQFIAGLAKFPKLEAVSFDNCRVDKSVIDLADLPNLKVLELDQADVVLPPSQRFGHLNAFGSSKTFIDELIRKEADSFSWYDYFNQPEWPGVCVQSGPGFG